MKDTLCFPPFEYKVKKIDGQVWIFDRIRKRYVVLTPEEWVRQHLLHFLIDSRNYPSHLIAVEKEINVCGLRKRFDVLCYDRKGNPFLIVECKAPTVALSQLTFDQAFEYNLTVDARYVAVTNGCTHYCGELTEEKVFVLHPDFPFFP